MNSRIPKPLTPTPEEISLRARARADILARYGAWTADALREYVEFLQRRIRCREGVVE